MRCTIRCRARGLLNLFLRNQLVWKAAEELPARQREVFLLRFVEDKSVQEIAEITGTAEKTVKSHLYRAMTGIRAGRGGAHV